MSDIELKLCPFCGGKAELTEYYDDYRWSASVGCTNECCGIHPFRNSHDSASPISDSDKKSLVDAWNTRA